MKLVMERDEIEASYRGAKDKRAQIEILADLNDCGEDDIVKVLADSGYEIPGEAKPKRTFTKKVRWDEATVAKLEEYVREGLNNAEIGKRLGTTEKSVSYQVSLRGLSGLRKPGRSKRKTQENIDGVYIKHLERELKEAKESCMRLDEELHLSREREEVLKAQIERMKPGRTEDGVIESLEKRLDEAYRDVKLLKEENEACSMAFAKEMEAASDEMERLRSEVARLSGCALDSDIALTMKSVKGLSHMVLCALKRLSICSSGTVAGTEFDRDILDGAMVGVAHIITEVTELMGIEKAPDGGASDA